MNMTRRQMLGAIGAGAGGVLVGPMLSRLLAADEAGTAKKPNIIVMMVDDMGYSDLGCYGGEIKTPHLDQLAAEGVRFTNFHNTSRCCPSRASILTGLYPHQTGLGYFEGIATGTMEERPGYQGKVCRPCVTMAEALKPLGYATFGGGKWHIGADPKQRGFDQVCQLPMMEYFLGKPPSAQNYSTHVLGNWVCGQIEQAAKAGKPFFCYWTPIAPHFPLQALSADVARYRGVYDAGPEAVALARLKRMREMGLVDAKWPYQPAGLPGGDDMVPVTRHTRKPLKEVYTGRVDCATELDVERDPNHKMSGWRDMKNKRNVRYFEEGMEIFAAQVDCLDQKVGKVVAKLKELGQFENTLFLFCSDNGCSNEGASVTEPWSTVSNTPFKRWKVHSMEGGIATPLIVHWPARIETQARGSINHSWGHLVDVMPTVLAAAGAAYPAKTGDGREIPPTEGRSLLPSLAGQRIPLEKPIFIEHAGNCGLIAEDWKICADDGGAAGPWSLYDMRNDRFETRDVAAERPEVVKTMDEQWNAIAARIGARRDGGRRARK
jgi:arylsulfatase A-like enzyme